MSSRSKKTVYVLGAGFSRPAGFSLQGELLRNLLESSLEDIHFLQGDILSEPEPGLAQIREYRRIITDFINHTFPSIELASLEDVFTLLDQAILGKANFSKFTQSDLRDIHYAFLHSVLLDLHLRADEFVKLGSDTPHCRLAAYWLENRLKAGQESDNFSIISLNWDSLVEESIYKILAEVGGIRGGRSLADIDYCVYTRPLGDSPHTPSTKQKASNIFNIKVLKLHGSATWLRCPCSNHVYTALGASTPSLDRYLGKKESPFISEFTDPREVSNLSLLEPYIITPTYSKVFDLPHIQTTWHNAFVELREADEVVFIGYSLPEADYHFRTLLRRAVRSNTSVQIFLHDSDDPTSDSNENYRPQMGNLDELERVPDPKAIYPVSRYKQVFNSEMMSLDYRGVEGLIENFAPTSHHADRLDELRKLFYNIRGQPSTGSVRET